MPRVKQDGKYVSLNVRITEDLDNRLTELIHASRMSKTNIVSSALEQYIISMIAQQKIFEKINEDPEFALKFAKICGETIDDAVSK